MNHALLRDQPRGRSAELTDFAIAYWNGHQVVYCFLRDDDSRHIEEEFDMAEYVWEEWSPAFAAWLSTPVFSARPQVLEGIKDTPPQDLIG